MGVYTPSSATATPIQPGLLDQWAVESSAFVALDVFPLFEVNEKYGVFKTRIPGQVVKKPVLTARADGAEALRDSTEFAEKTWSCNWNSRAAEITDRKRDEYMKHYGIDLVALRRRDVLFQMMARHEYAVASIVQSSSNFALSGSSGLQVSADWNTPASSTPVTDVNVGIGKIFEKCGMTPNVMVIPNIMLARQIVMSDEVRSSLGLTNNDATNLSSRVTPEILQAIFDIPKVKIAGVYAANDYQPSGTPAALWDANRVFLAYVNPSRNVEAMTVGRTYSWNRYGTVFNGKEFREESKEQTVVEVSTETDENLMMTACGFLIDVTP